MYRNITDLHAREAHRAFKAMRQYIELAATSGPQLAASYADDARLLLRMAQDHARIAREMLYYRLEHCLL